MKCIVKNNIESKNNHYSSNNKNPVMKKIEEMLWVKNSNFPDWLKEKAISDIRERNKKK